MRIVHVGAELQPRLGLVVHTCVSCIALHVRVIYDTVILQIAERCVCGNPVGSPGYAGIVLLAERCPVCGLCPVIRLDVEFLAVIDDSASDGGSRVHLAVDTDELLSVRDIEYLISESAVVCGAYHYAVRFRVSVCLAHSGAEVVVSQCVVLSLVVERRVLYVVVVPYCPGVHAPLGIHIDDGVL